MKGWHKESYRHYLAAKGIKTNRYLASNRKYLMAKWDSKAEKSAAMRKVYDEFQRDMKGVNNPEKLFVVAQTYHKQLKFMNEHKLISDLEFEGFADELNEIF